MCKVLVGITRRKNNQKFNQIITSQEESLRTQKDGVGAIAMSSKFTRRMRALKKYNSIFQQVYKNLSHSNLIGIHTRTSTSGSVNEANVHFFRIKEFIFAHNGIVWNHSQYSFSSRTSEFDFSRSLGFHSEDECIECMVAEKPCKKHKIKEKRNWKKEDLMCDSYRFLQKIASNKEVNLKVISDIAGKERFMGIGFLIDLKRKILYVLAERELNIHTDSKSYMILYSYEPNEVFLKKKEFFGIPIIQNSKMKVYQASPGIYEINLKDILN